MEILLNINSKLFIASIFFEIKYDPTEKPNKKPDRITAKDCDVAKLYVDNILVHKIS